MYVLKISGNYKSNLKKLKKSGKWKSIEPELLFILEKLEKDGYAVFIDDNLDKKYNDHVLYEDRNYQKGTHEVHVKPNVLLTYITDDKRKIVTLLNISSHSGSRVTSSLENLEASVKARLQAANKNAV